jgi:uncharacterized protein YndB with AHSA1/START domain
MSKLPEFISDREFDARRNLVWRAWTDPELLARWYGPNIETVIHKFDLKPGGVWLNEMKMKSMSDFSRMTFTEVAPEERLVWHHSTTDADWNLISNPMMPEWPRVLLTTVTFEEAGDKTKVRLTWTPFEASDAEIACFAGAMDGFGSGWGAGYTIIDAILAELKS